MMDSDLFCIYFIRDQFEILVRNFWIVCGFDVIGSLCYNSFETIVPTLLVVASDELLGWTTHTFWMTQSILVK